jgi:dienelactone hydrolase
MPAMARIVRIVSAAAFAVFLLASVWLARLDRAGPPHADLVLAGGVPATLFLPAEAGVEGMRAFLDAPPRDARPPAIVLMHGFAGDRLSLSSLARRLASAGYAVLAIDARGHGQNRNPLHRGWARADDFEGDLAAAVDWLRVCPFVDGQRLVVMGHSMGAGAALDFATRDSGIDGAVLISGGRRLDGPYRPPNALFLVAEGDPPAIRERAAELVARLAGVPSAEPGRPTGSFAAGTAVELSVVPGANHLSIVWRADSVREIVAWLDAIFGVERAAGGPPRDPRIPALALMALAFVGVLPGLGLLVGWLAPHDAERAPGSRARALGLVALALVATMPLLATGTPAEIVSAEVLDSVVAQLALAGVGLLLWLRWRAPGTTSSLLRDPLRVLPAVAVGLLAVFTLTQVFGVAVHRSTLSPERMAVFAMAAAGLLPFSLAFQALLRRGPPLRAALSALAGRAVVALVLLAGVATGVLPSVVVLLLGPLCGVFALMELLAAGVYAGSRNLLAIALLDAGWLAMVAAAIMPVRF